MDSYKTNYNFIVLLLLTLHCIVCDNSIYRIPVAVYYSYEKDNSNDLIRDIFYNFLYVNLSIGTPPQIIPFHLDINSQTFYVSNKFFNRTTSSTYKSLSKKEIRYSFEDAISGFNSKDILNINGDKKYINFIYETKNKKTNDVGSIGLLIPTQFQQDVVSFFNSLKQSEIISSFIWTLKFNNNINKLDILFNAENNIKIIGELIIGDHPHNYENNKRIYNKEKYTHFNIKWNNNKLFWDIEFSKIYLKFKDNQTISEENNNNIMRVHGDRLTEINPDIGFIVAPIEFFYIIKRYYFDKRANFCRTIKITDTLLRYIECDNSKDFNVSSFPDIYFEIDNVIFNLTYKDLFILDKNKNKFIFLIFYEGYIGNWVFGRLFLAKYQLTFNEPEKTIGFYATMNDYIEIKDENKIISFIVNIIRILFLSFIIIFFIYSIYIKKNIKRKKRINELDEEQSDEKNKNNGLLNNIDDKNNI